MSTLDRSGVLAANHDTDIILKDNILYTDTVLTLNGNPDNDNTLVDDDLYAENNLRQFREWKYACWQRHLRCWTIAEWTEHYITRLQM